MITVVNTPDSMPAANSWGYLPRGNRSETLTQHSKWRAERLLYHKIFLLHTRLAVELEMRPLLLISAEVPHQCIIRAKHLRSLGFKALVPTATISQLFTAIVFANIPHTCGFYTAFPIDFYSQQSLLPTVSRILLSDLSLHASPCLCSQQPHFCNPSEVLCCCRVCPASLHHPPTLCIYFHI